MSLALAACGAPSGEAMLAGSTKPSVANSVERAPASGTSIAPAGGGSPKGRRAGVDAIVDDARGPCPRSMADIDGRFCIDRYEASLIDVLSNGEERPHSPFSPIADQHVRAVSSPSVFPQAYVSAVEAEQACAESGKRLCRVVEWVAACRGPEARSFGYGDRREPGRCNDTGKNPVLSLYGRGHWTWTIMNQPELNQLERTLSKTGDHPGCTNGYGVYDMVGNLHEWVADRRGVPSGRSEKGAFYGGYYQDVASRGHGQGCGYRTTAHEPRYHDYSTGFRCCADVAR